jgi:protein-L-isoaspartate(D-aspartate) O-methyltransferase
MNTELARFNMIEQQIRPWDVLDPAVLDALARVKREDFVPPAHAALAFADVQVPLLEGRAGACMLEPRLQARMVQELKLKPGHRVLEIGCGSGFTSALMAALGAEVLAVEQDAQIAELARCKLAAAGTRGVQLRCADGSDGWPAEAPFDAILLGGSVHEVPQALLDQLADGGCLLAIVGVPPIMRARRHTRSAGGFAHHDLFDTAAPPLEGFAAASRFVF